MYKKIWFTHFCCELLILRVLGNIFEPLILAGEQKDTFLSFGLRAEGGGHRSHSSMAPHSQNKLFIHSSHGLKLYFLCFVLRRSVGCAIWRSTLVYFIKIILWTEILHRTCSEVEHNSVRQAIKVFSCLLIVNN